MDIQHTQNIGIQHSHTERGGHFYTGDSSSPTSRLDYRMAGTHKMIIDHTEVNEHKGEGIGTQLVAAAVKYARLHGIKIMPVCNFAKVILENNKEYEDVLIPPH
jgi:predicted GNAT family acetyltransferase